MRLVLAGLLGLAALSLAACGSSGSPSTTAGSNELSTTAAKSVSNKWAREYIGGKAGPAGSGEEPIKIGYINEQGGIPSFPEATEGLEAAVEYVDQELGGADGHPIEISNCFIQSEEDGQKCATQMANDPQVKFVILGVTTHGQKAIYSILTGHKPIISASPSTIDDLTAKEAYAYNAGGPGTVAGLGIFAAKKLHAKSAAVVYGENPAAQASAQEFLKPLLQQEGVEDVKLVGISEEASGPEVASALQSVGADEAEALITFVTVPDCIAIYDGLRSLGIEPAVVATGLCFGKPMTEHMEDLGSSDPVPNGWYFSSYGYSYFVPDEASGMTTYLAKIKQYAGEEVEYTGFAGFLFADVLTSVKFINEIGAEKLTSTAMQKTASGFAGPMMLTAGKMECGYSPTFPALCGKEVSIEQFKDGKWHLTASGNKSIDIGPALGG